MFKPHLSSMQHAPERKLSCLVSYLILNKTPQGNNIIPILYMKILSWAGSGGEGFEESIRICQGTEADRRGSRVCAREETWGLSGRVRSEFSRASLDPKVQGVSGPRRGHWEDGAESMPQKASGSVREGQMP